MRWLLLLGLLLAPGFSQDAETQAWNAAAALKQKSAYREAAQAFEAFTATYPESARLAAAQVEAGVCHFSAGRAALQLYRITPTARAEFDAALALFERVKSERPQSAEASRACYMQGSTRYFAGELEQAESAYGAVLDQFATDRGYVAKALERRAFVRRHLLKTEPSIADLERWLKDFGATDKNAETVRKDLTFARTLGKPAPPFTTESWPAGEAAPLEALGGHVVALYFFATWCPNCAKELPFVLELERRYHDRVRFVGVMDHGKGQTPETVKAYCREHSIPFSVAMTDGSASTTYQVLTIPHLVLIDRQGVVRWRDNPSSLVDWTIDTLLSEEQGAK